MLHGQFRFVPTYDPPELHIYLVKIPIFDRGILSQT
jgi:hypothetical protein